jgi:hypothetical protein
VVLLIAYILVACAMLSHLEWFVRTSLSPSYRLSHGGNLEQDVLAHLDKLAHFARQNIVISLVMMLCIAVLNAISTVYGYISPSFVRRSFCLLFGLGSESGGIMNLGVFGICWGCLCMVSLLLQIRTRLQTIRLIRIKTPRIPLKFSSSVLLLLLLTILLAIMVVIVWVCCF